MSEVDDEIESCHQPLVDSESEDEESSNPKRGHVWRHLAIIETTVQDKDDITDEDL